MTLRLWLLGAGIAQSPSPSMQNAALAAAGVEGSYTLRDCDAAGLAEAVAELRSGSAQGANVTIPHKRAAAALCDRLEGDAALLGAVNTLAVEGGAVIGANTDALGFEGAMREHRLWPAPGAAAVVLGAGGAATAVVLALSRAQAEWIGVAARRVERAQACTERFQSAGAATRGAGPPANQSAHVVVPLGFDDPALRRHLGGATLVVNATPAGLAALPVDVDALDPEAVVVDLRYRPRPVDLVAAATASGRRGADGLGMLLHQGMLSFQRWTGLPAPWEAARAALHAAVGESV